MRLKVFFVFILSFFIICCSNNKLEKDVPLFKKLVGKENVKTIDFLINDFEKYYLKREFPELETNDAYEQFLIKVKKKGEFDIADFSTRGIDKFWESKLLLDIYEFADSVWVENGIIKSQINDKFRNGTTDIRIRESHKHLPQNFDLDSLILSELNLRELKYYGKYINALDSIKNRNNYMNNYVDIHKSAGKISPSIVAGSMLTNNLDYSNYIIKSIVILELVY